MKLIFNYKSVCEPQEGTIEIPTGSELYQCLSSYQEINKEEKGFCLLKNTFIDGLLRTYAEDKAKDLPNYTQGVHPTDMMVLNDKEKLIYYLESYHSEDDIQRIINRILKEKEE